MHTVFSLLVMAIVCKAFVPPPHFDECVGSQNRATVAENPNLFHTVVKSEHFVDKTSLIKHFHRQRTPILVTAPRFFGKSTALSMLRAFYEIPVDQRGIVVAKNTTANHAAFASLINRERSSDKTIFEDAKWCGEQFGSLPVLYYSFENLSVASTDEFLESFRHLTAGICNDHKYLLQSKRLNSTDKDLYRSYCDNPKLKREAVSSSGRDLSTLLSLHFDQPCLVLVDELDAPVLKTLTIAKKEWEVLDLLKEFMTRLLVNNTAATRAFLTGNTRLVKIVCPTTIVHWRFTEDEEMVPFFGFTEYEVDFLIRETDLLLKDIRAYYDGYRGQNSSKWLYNPHSIVRFLKTNWFGVYWSAVLPLEVFTALYKKDEFVRGVFSCGSAQKEIKVESPRDFRIEEHVSLLREILSQSRSITTTDEMVILVEFLYQLGYFTDKTVPRSASDQYFTVVTPSKEVSEIFMRFCKNTEICK